MESVKQITENVVEVNVEGINWNPIIKENIINVSEPYIYTNIIIYSTRKNDFDKEGKL